MPIIKYEINLTPREPVSTALAMKPGVTPPGLKEIYRLEQAIAQNLEQVDCPVTHHFAKGQYAREMFIPAGTVATGAVHKTEHLTVIAQGRLKLMTEDGVQEFCAPAVILSKPGIKRAAFALEDTVLITIHPTDETDLDRLVEELTESKACELLGGTNNIQLEHQRLKSLGD